MGTLIIHIKFIRCHFAIKCPPPVLVAHAATLSLHRHSTTVQHAERHSRFSAAQTIRYPCTDADTLRFVGRMKDLLVC